MKPIVHARCVTLAQAAEFGFQEILNGRTTSLNVTESNALKRYRMREKYSR